MHLAYVMTPDRGATDRLLSALAEHLQAQGTALAGIVQTNTECHDDALCDMDVRVLPKGDTIRISQSLGPEARGCRLDPAALEQAVAQVTSSLHATPLPDLLIVNKFGKHEADGRGMRPVIGEAMALGIPVVSGVNKMNVEAFQEFAGGLAVAVEPSVEALLAWVAQTQRRDQSESA
ncbi:MAG: 3-dehydroquinate dehydratase [Rhodobacteraceae bacterium]|nr:MAG: 3-dehydroquinate dehydratase [Paracoccaceae bacterium]